MTATTDGSGGTDLPVRAARLLELAERSAEAVLADARRRADGIVAAAEERAAAREEAAREALLAARVDSRRLRQEAEASVAALLDGVRDARAQVRALAGRLVDLADGGTGAAAGTAGTAGPRDDDAPAG
ncbi:hypothetical protein [Kineococcus gypseus]|uniref:hypothetical protein n=1 Tax=Kineococcus gypseus TaxID=1637102 RepID=UPI003D7CF8C6